MSLTRTFFAALITSAAFLSSSRATAQPPPSPPPGLMPSPPMPPAGPAPSPPLPPAGLAPSPPMPPPVVAPPLPAPPIVGPDGLPPLGPLPPGLIPPPPPPPPIPGRPISGTLDLPPAPNYPRSDWDLSIDIDGASTSVALANVRFGGTSLAGGFGFQLTRFLSPVVDDLSPRTLQPFLQRTSSVFGSLSFSGESDSIERAMGMFGTVTKEVEKSVDASGGPTVGLDIYASPEFAITAGFGYAYDARSTAVRSAGAEVDVPEKYHRLTPHAGVAARFGDVRIDLSYAFEGDAPTSDTPSTTQKWGTLALGAEAVFARAVDVQLLFQAYDAGAGARARVEVFPTKDLGLFGGAFGFAGRTAFNSTASENEYGGFLGAEYWFADRVRGSLDYQLSGLTEISPSGPTNESAIGSALRASLNVRLP